MVRTEDENSAVAEPANAEVAPLPATADIAASTAATAAISASMRVPIARESSSVPTRLPPLVPSGNDCTVVFAMKPISI